MVQVKTGTGASWAPTPAASAPTSSCKEQRIPAELEWDEADATLRRPCGRLQPPGPGGRHRAGCCRPAKASPRSAAWPCTRCCAAAASASRCCARWPMSAQPAATGASSCMRSARRRTSTRAWASRPRASPSRKPASRTSAGAQARAGGRWPGQPALCRCGGLGAQGAVGGAALCSGCSRCSLRHGRWRLAAALHLTAALVAAAAVAVRKRDGRRRRRHGRPLAKHRDADHPHVVRPAGAARVRIGHGGEFEGRDLRIALAPPRDVAALAAREHVAVLQQARGFAGDHVDAVHGHHGHDAFTHRIAPDVREQRVGQGQQGEHRPVGAAERQAPAFGRRHLHRHDGIPAALRRRRGLGDLSAGLGGVGVVHDFLAGLQFGTSAWTRNPRRLSVPRNWLRATTSWPG
jgi:hypothetical protein